MNHDGNERPTSLLLHPLHSSQLTEAISLSSVSSLLPLHALSLSPLRLALYPQQQSEETAGAVAAAVVEMEKMEKTLFY